MIKVLERLLATIAREHPAMKVSQECRPPRQRSTPVRWGGNRPLVCGRRQSHAQRSEVGGKLSCAVAGRQLPSRTPQIVTKRSPALITGYQTARLALTLSRPWYCGTMVPYVGGGSKCQNCGRTLRSSEFKRGYVWSAAYSKCWTRKRVIG